MIPAMAPPFYGEPYLSSPHSLNVSHIRTLRDHGHCIAGQEGGSNGDRRSARQYQSVSGAFRGDACDPEIVETLGLSYKIVVTNNFLCHMDVPMAVRALRKPVEELLEEVHDGDPCMKASDHAIAAGWSL
jgi:hypothetical protein